MRLKFVVVVAMVMAMAGVAAAVSLQNGPQDAKFDDFTSIYRPPDATTIPQTIARSTVGQTLDPVLHPGGANFAPILTEDENRAIFEIDTIKLDIAGNPPPEYSRSVDPDRLDGMFYDLGALAPASAPTIANPTSTVFYGALGRNPILTDVNGNPIPALAGGVLEVWLDEPPLSAFNELATGPADPNGLTGPSAWDEANAAGTAAAIGAHGHAVAPDVFPTVNSSGETLWLQLVFIPYPGAGGGFPLDPPAGTLIRESLQFGGTGSGEAYAMVVGGSFAPFVCRDSQRTRYDNAWDLLDDGLTNGSRTGPDGVTYTADAFIRFNIDPQDATAPPWLAASDDPTKFAVCNPIPEPVTMLGLMMGAGAVVGYIRKRR